MLHLPLRRPRFRSASILACAACLLLAAVSYTQAAEPLELRNREKPTPSQPSGPSSPAVPPVQSGPGVVIVPSPPSPQTVVPVVPQPTDPTTPQIVTPEVKDPQVVTPPVVVIPTTPPQPIQPDIRPAPSPEQPQSPVAEPPGTVVIVPTAPEAKAPEKEAKDPEKKDEKLLTPESFLLTTPEPDKKAPVKPEEKRQVEKKPEKKPELARKEPPKEPEEKKQPEEQKQPEAKKPEKNEPPKKGDPLQIPEEAIKTGQLDFLEGCWVGTRPEYHTKRIITERFCFGKDGTGKRFISDPPYAGECVGATKAVLNQGGILRMQSEKMYCSNTPENWGASEMTCQGEGNQTPCSWVFHDAGGGRQSYTIRFVRE